jgi:hypothetical protein
MATTGTTTVAAAAAGSPTTDAAAACWGPQCASWGPLSPTNFVRSFFLIRGDENLFSFCFFFL